SGNGEAQEGLEALKTRHLTQQGVGDTQLDYFGRFVAFALSSQDQAAQRVVRLRIRQVANLSTHAHADHEQIHVLDHRARDTQNGHKHNHPTNSLTLFDTLDEGRTLNVQAHQCTAR